MKAGEAGPVVEEEGVCQEDAWQNSSPIPVSAPQGGN